MLTKGRRSVILELISDQSHTSPKSVFVCAQSFHASISRLALLLLLQIDMQQIRDACGTDAPRFCGQPTSQSADLNQYLHAQIPLPVEDPEEVAVRAEDSVFYVEGLAVSRVSFDRRGKWGYGGLR
jgi:hypothetical protein